MFWCIVFGCIFRMSVQVLEIISLPLSLFQLFLTWTCSVICFTHSTEMAQLRGLDKVESHTVVKPNRFTVLNCPDIRRQRNQGIL